VLNQIALPRACLPGRSQRLAHHIQLVIARENLVAALLAALGILALRNLGVVLQNIGQAFTAEGFLPQVGGLEAVGIGRIARAIVPAFVEGQEPRIGALQVRAHAHFLVIHGKVHHTAPELEEQLARIAVALVLLHGILHRLLGEAVLEFEGGYGQPVDEEAEIERELRLIAAVAQLPCDAEDVGGKARRGLRIAGRGGAVEQVHRQRSMLDSLA